MSRGDLAFRAAPPPKLHVAETIARAAATSGVDFGYLFGQAQIESGLDPNARAATSSATGLYQFTRQTWLATVKRHGAAHGLQWAAEAIRTGEDGVHTVNDPTVRNAIMDLREQPAAASAMAAAFAKDNQAFLADAVGGDLEAVDLYLAHFLGPAGAAQFLNAHRVDPNAPAASLFPAAAGANRAVFYSASGAPLSFDQIRAGFARKLSGAAAGELSPGTAARTIRSDRRAVLSEGPAMMRDFEPMPKRLSLAFASQAYSRLAALGTGS